MMLSEQARAFLINRRPNDKQVMFFNTHADEWDEINRNDSDKLEYIVGLIDIKPYEAVLDIGTGTGVMIPFYLRRLDTGRVMALDFSERMIKVAMSKNPPSEKLAYRISDVCDLPPTASYDVAVCYSCFPHFPDPVKALGSIAGALKTGGRLVIAHSSSKEHINNVHRCGGEAISNDYLPNMSIMTELFEEQGLETIFSRDDQDYYIIIGKKVI